MNIGNPNEHTILDLIDEISKLITNTSKIIYHPLPENDPKIRKPDISLAKKF